MIHEKGIIHGDLKPQNILMTGSQYDVKLTDFGISRVLSKKGFCYDQQGTLPYCSPEVIKGEPYNQKTDVWALGCILYELCTNRRAFTDLTDSQLKDNILMCNVPQLPLLIDERL